MDESKKITLSRTYTTWGIVVIVWSLYRFYLTLPEAIDTFIFKPLILLAPVFLVLKKENRSLASTGLSKGKFFRDLYLGLLLGGIFVVEALMANFAKYGHLSLVPSIPVTTASLFVLILLSLAAAFSEELFARGFIYSRLKEGYGSELKALFFSTSMYLMLLVPIILSINRLTGLTVIIYVATSVVMSFANTMIFSETKTLTIPILLHAFWNMAVVLYL